MGRYTLKTDIFTIQGFEKSKLSDIDRFTSQFSSEDELLKSLGITGKLLVSYNMNGEKRLKVAYKDKDFLSKLTYLENKKINNSNIIFREQIEKFLDRVFEDKDFYSFVTRTKLINEMTKFSIRNYISARKSCDVYREEDVRNLEQRLNDVCFYLSEYLQFRNMLFIVEEYEGYLAEQEAARLESEALELAKERELEERFSHQEEFFTTEDYNKHKEYIFSHNIPVPDSMKDKVKDLWSEE